MTEKLVTIVGILMILGWIKIELSHRKRLNKATKRCSSCGMQIPIRAEICPYCKKKPGFNFIADTRVYGGPIAYFFIILCILAAIGSVISRIIQL